MKLKREVKVIQIQTKCPSCSCSVSALSFGVKARVLCFCPWCGLSFFRPAVGRLVPWSPGALPPRPAPVPPPAQMSLFA